MLITFSVLFVPMINLSTLVEWYMYPSMETISSDVKISSTNVWLSTTFAVAISSFEDLSRYRIVYANPGTLM